MNDKCNIMAIYIYVNQDSYVRYHLNTLLENYNTEDTLIYDIYIDNKDTAKSEYNRMVKDMKNKKFNVVCTMAMTLVSRESLILCRLLSELKNNNCELISYIDRINTTKQGFSNLQKVIGSIKPYKKGTNIF